MKTLKEIKQEEESLLKEIKHTSTDNEVKRIRRRLEFLKTCRLYIETKPSEQYLESQLQQLHNKVGVINQRFGAWSSGKIGGGAGASQTI